MREFGNKVIGAEKSWDNFPEQKCMTAALGGVTHSREHGDGRPWASLPSCELDSQRRLGDTEPDFPESRPGGHGRLNSQALPQLPISLLNAADVSPGLEAKPGARAGSPDPPHSGQLLAPRACPRTDSILRKTSLAQHFPPRFQTIMGISLRQEKCRRDAHVEVGLAPAGDGGGDRLMG